MFYRLVQINTRLIFLFFCRHNFIKMKTLFISIIISLIGITVSNSIQAQQQEITLSGIILCEDSVKGPLGFVSVYNKNTKKGTVSNANGEFSISMGKNDTILFSTVQHVQQIYSIKANEIFYDKSIDISMEQDTIWLGVVSVIGFKEYEEFKKEVINLKLTRDKISINLPIIDKYANPLANKYANPTFIEGQYELKGALTYLLKKIHVLENRPKDRVKQE